MKKVFVLILVFAIATWFYQNYVARTPFSILKKAGLNISEANKIIEFSDDWGGIFNIHGDGQTIVWLKVIHEPFLEIINQLDKTSMKPLPISGSDVYKIPDRFMKFNKSKGYYKIENIDIQSYRLLIVDSTKSEILFTYSLN